MDYPILGMVTLFAFNFAPQNWAECKGQILSVYENQALFALIGATYGGDGRTTFALPNLQGAEPHPSCRYYIALQGMWPPRQ